jgi:hypothetical protein
LPAVTHLPACDAPGPCRIVGAWLTTSSREAAYVHAITSTPTGAASPCLAALRGGTWARLDIPPADDARDPTSNPRPLSLAADGTLWTLRTRLRSSGDRYEPELWRRTADGFWARAELPADPGDPTNPLIPHQVLARGPGDVWVTATSFNQPVRAFVLRTKAQKVVTR